MESSLCDVSMEVNVDDNSQLNSSTVTISFEEFVRSQSQDRAEDDVEEDQSEIVPEVEEMDTDQLNVGSVEAPFQISPRTVTVQAEVHVVSPKQEAKAVGRLASIFNRRRELTNPVEVVSSPHTEAGNQLPSISVTGKRKSNVVLQEEDLELYVLESESTPKCSETERKQFMAAFKQPSLDGSRTKPGKSQGKQKQPEEKVSDDADKVQEEDTVVTPSVEQAPAAAAATEENKVAKKKPARRGRKKAKEEKEVVTDPPAAAAPVEETVATIAEVDDKQRRASHHLNSLRPKMSTPKTRRSKHGVFVAEMVCPPDTNQSPIRIKFRRVHKNVSVTKADVGNGKNNSLAAKTSEDSKKRKQAKKLVEKAKVIQQSKKAAVEEKDTLRRSSRAEASAKKSYCEDEAPKVASQGQEKTARKVSAVISIFDESSHEGSENSQDDEQFRARREFLKSGLPESFRKQIAKTAATKEAYSLSCSSFQAVTHTKQPPNDCPLWSLLWPESALLCHLKDLWCQTSSPPPSVSGSLCVKTEPARRAVCERGSSWRPEISESFRQLLMEEVGASNPPFPVQTFITRFLKRRTDHQQQCTASEPEAVTRVTSVPLPTGPVGGKRKRMDDEGEMAVKVAKKQRANSSEEKTSTAEPEPTRRGGRTRRSQRSRQEEEANEKTKPSVKAAPIPPEDDSVVVIDDLLLGDDTEKKDVVKEDVLWTDKYQPQHTSDIIGNTSGHSDWDCGEEESHDGEDMLCNTVLITGPTGVGKTAAVYACAQELGFKVFEVNASSQRSGRLILSQLKEATQSHQVDSQGVNAHKPTYFNSYGTSSSAGTLRPGSSPRKVNSPRRVVSSPRKPPQSPRGAKRGGLAPTSLANFFKMGRPTSKEAPNTMKNEQTAASKKVVKAKECTVKQKDRVIKSPPATTPKEKNNEEQSKKTATSLILFEEVDVIFDDDSGFLSAIKTFMTTTKRPVILTTSDPAFSNMFDGNFEEIHFTRPSVLNVGSFLRLLCLAEDMRTDLGDVRSLLRLNGCDIRQSLLQLQFWTRSGGGRNISRPLTHTGSNVELKPEAEEAAVCLPPCHTGCTETTLGLLNIEPERDIWELLRGWSPAEEASCWELLTDSKRRGVDLLYSNMETLLPLPLTQLTTSTYKPKESVSHIPRPSFC
ncbi:ATPase family AAA domain-containing protein 5 [Larimichthys crocea]|uniref:Uncharacterized protein n=1 Tax=Larimichthys crocea TaxID=215358 RepID=A0ACD3R5Q6_LARCR|nr:ATPase family AAA domain-containing protein 5 [Larimichthys crocea]